MTMNLINSAIVLQVEQSEIKAVVDRMTAIKEREGNPEGIEILKFNNTVACYSKTMPWPQFNTVKGLTEQDLEHLDEIIAFYEDKNRKVQFELVPSASVPVVFEALSKRGFAQSGFHTSLYRTLPLSEADLGQCAFFQGRQPERELVVRPLKPHEIEEYAAIHCYGSGLGESGIIPVAANNKVLLGRAGWHFFMGLIDGEPAGVGVQYIQDGISNLTFAATLTEHRGLGIQQALIHRRLQEAVSQGCHLAVSQAAYLSPSHRNMQRMGMSIAYTRATWIRQ